MAKQVKRRLLILKDCSGPGWRYTRGTLTRAIDTARGDKLISLGNAVDVTDEQAFEAEVAKLEAQAAAAADDDLLEQEADAAARARIKAALEKAPTAEAPTAEAPAADPQK